MIGQDFAALFEQIEKSPHYAASKAAQDFAIQLEKKLREQGMTRAELARRIGKSKPYVTKVLRGEANFTLQTMTALAEAVGARFHPHLADGRCSRVRIFEELDGGKYAKVAVKRDGSDEATAIAA